MLDLFLVMMIFVFVRLDVVGVLVMDYDYVFGGVVRS